MPRTKGPSPEHSFAHLENVDKLIWYTYPGEINLLGIATLLVVQ